MRNFFKFTFLILFSFCAKAQVPTATILSAQAYYCTNSPVFFASQTVNGPTSFTWALPRNRGAAIISSNRDTTTQSGSTDSSVVCSFSLPGVYTLSLTVANGTLSSLATKTIVVTRAAVAAFNASLIATGFPTQLSLKNYSTDTIKSYWTFNDNFLKDSSNYFIRPYNGSGSYTVTLVALGKNGCNDTLSYGFRISDTSGVTLPNIFSPNDDNVNDLFQPIVRGIYSLNAWIYNREGVLISSWDRVEGSWDGYTTSGLKCVEGQYFAILEAKGFDGKSYKLKTTLTLVR